MRLTATVVLLLLLVSPSGTAWSEETVSERVDFDFFWRLSPSIFKIEARNADGGVSVGSGVLVAEGSVVTNCHVTRNATHIRVAKHALRWEVQAQASDLRHDLCLLSVPDIKGRIAPISETQPKVGQPVVAVGYVGGTAPRISGGEVRALYSYDGAQVIQNTAWFNSGASGGGLFDREGRLIGILAFRHQGGHAYYFALPVEWILSARLDAARAQAVMPLGAELAFWQEVGERQPYFLKAAALEATNDWTALRKLAQRWTARERDKPDGWLWLAKASEALGDSEGAIAAYTRAIQSDFECAEAWYGLGRAYASLGRRRELQEVQRVLVALNGALAGKLIQWARTH